MYKKQQTIENEFHVAMSAEKSPPASTSSMKISSPSTSTTATVQEETQQPSKPPRQKSKSLVQSTQVETTIDNLDSIEDKNDVSAVTINRACGTTNTKAN